ncbi:regulatory protein, luxR family [Mucilaginibacter pineti]|uniref:Regulatory protein, luxR family n=2 Tax=Mucilaginibacter pineti TaxID=1391627 RepID=A0A1G7ERB1_9SPHI|nr:regulatory protein, luxR family [Mucilaginibacter pineti]
MRLFGTEMHPVTGLLAAMELFLLGAQLMSWLYFPKDRRGLLYVWLLVLMILYNIFGGFFPDPSLSWIHIKLQMMLAWGSGFAVAAYLPYYFYAAFELKKLKFFAFKGMLFFLALPYFIFFVAEYHLSEDIDFSIRWGLIAPALYGVAFFWYAFKAIGERYRGNLESERLEMYLTYIAVLPWICMIPFGYFRVSQLTEVLTTNTGFLVITAILAARSVRERRQQRDEKDRTIILLKLTAAEIFEANCLKFDITPRERDILQYIKLGMTNKEIGEKLFIAEKTVGNNLQNLHLKTGAKTRTELVNILFTAL